ncbi:MAG: hypothetical protein CM1200mP7_3820 [Chloroflexota bacterium]|nr:MAG: hypothetical protein CM1200mP7_3820 [Chloroflexota bacterium]
MPLKLKPIPMPLKQKPMLMPLKLKPMLMPLKLRPMLMPLKLRPMLMPLKLKPMLMPLKQKPCAQEKTKNFQIGMDFLINQNYDKAIASFKKHIKLNPDDINGYIKIAEAYYESNQQNEAFKYINKALEKNF